MNILISFVGVNDGGALYKKPEGAIITVFKEKRFDEAHLIYNPTESDNYNFYKIARHVEKELIKGNYCKKIYLHSFDCRNVVDHNEIYPKLLGLLNDISGKYKLKKPNYTAAISSGTPAMQVCWILIAESGDFPVKLIRSNEPRFGKPYVTEIKLNTSLPKIVRLKEEIEELKKENKKLLPEIKIDISKGSVLIDGLQIPFSPVEFSYYRYFLDRNLSGKENMKLTSITVPGDFLNKVIEFHKMSFPEAESSRENLLKIKNAGFGYSSATFRANVSKINKKIKAVINDAYLVNFYMILGEGLRFGKHYGISLPSEKIIVV